MCILFLFFGSNESRQIFQFSDFLISVYSLKRPDLSERDHPHRTATVSRPVKTRAILYRKDKCGEGTAVLAGARAGDRKFAKGPLYAFVILQRQIFR